jgi:hypothetical protein
VKGLKMNTKQTVGIAALVAAACAVAAIVRGTVGMAAIVTMVLAAMCVASVLMGFVLRRFWHMTLWCVWLVAAQAWLLHITDCELISWANLRNGLQFCDLGTLCVLTMLASSVALVRPCHELGANLRRLLAAHPHSRGLEAGQLA